MSNPVMNRARLLIICHSYAATENRKKIQALASHFEIVCVTSTHETHLVLGRSASDFDDDSDAVERRFELARCRRTTTKDTAFLYLGLASVMRRGRFDVILVENEPWALVCWQARMLKGWLQPQALFGEFTWENVERQGLKGWVVDKIYRATAITTDFVIAGSQRTAAMVMRRGMSNSRVLIAGQLGVDLTNHLPANREDKARLRRSMSLPENGFIVGYCGRLTEAKGIHELLAACDGMEGIHLALMGAGQMLPWLQEQARTRPWLHLLGSRPHAQVPNFLRCLDVFVLASKPLHQGGQNWEEQFGHVLIEAMACHVATAGSDSGAIPEVVEEAEVTFPWGDASALRQILVRLQSDSTYREALVQRQFRRVLDKHTHQALAGTWAEFIYQQLRQKS